MDGERKKEVRVSLLKLYVESTLRSNPELKVSRNEKRKKRGRQSTELKNSIRERL